MGERTAIRGLQNPIGAPAPPGHPGDMVKITDGDRAIYLSPSEHNWASPAHLRWLLAARPYDTGHHERAGEQNDQDERKEGRGPPTTARFISTALGPCFAVCHLRAAACCTDLGPSSSW